MKLFFTFFLVGKALSSMKSSISYYFSHQTESIVWPSFLSILSEKQGILTVC